MSESVQEILQRIDQLAEEDRLLLQEQLSKRAETGRSQRASNGAHTLAKRNVADILDEIARNRFREDPAGPTVADMLREDRNR